MARLQTSTLIFGALLCLSGYRAGAQELAPANVSGALNERRALATPDHPAIGYSASRSVTPWPS